MDVGTFEELGKVGTAAADEAEGAAADNAEGGGELSIRSVLQSMK